VESISPKMKIIDWQCHFTAHQLYTWRAFGDVWPDDVIHVVARLESETRKKQGWEVPSLDDLHIVSLKRNGGLRQGLKILKENKNAIHVFGGFWADRRFIILVIYAVFMGIKVSVMNEPYSTDSAGYLSESSDLIGRIKSWLRPALYGVTAKLLRSSAKPQKFSVLALSKIAEKQFIAAGFSPSQVFPFGYFVPKVESEQLKYNGAENVQLIYVGALLKTKGVDVAVKAIEALAAKNVPVRMDIYGYGNPDDFVDQLSTCVSYKGIIPFGKSQEVIAKYDALILPSRHDGWGVVVNEALLQGVPAIVSSDVGAKCLVEESGAGAVFKSGDKNSLHRIVEDFVKSEKLRGIMKSNAMKVSLKITPERAAVYMSSVFSSYFNENETRPKEIWLE